MATTTTAQTPSANSLAPSNALTNTNGNNFLLFNGYWLDLQSFVTTSLNLPLTQGDFTTKYGTFSDMNQVTNCITQLNNIAQLSSTMGNPNTLQAKINQNPNYISGNTMPAELYAQCIWLASQINNVASTFQLTYSSLSEIFTGNPTADAASVQQLLCGQGGLQSQAAALLSSVQTIQANLSSFQAKFAVAAAGVNTYFNQSVTILTDAQNAITADKNQITTLQAQANQAYTEWRDYTISATTTSIGIMVLSAGFFWPVAVGLGVGLGVEAAKEMHLYNEYTADIASDNADKLKKKQLYIDLSGFNTSVAQVNTLCQDFANALSQIEGVWLDQNTKLTKVADMSADQIGTYAKVVEIFDLLNAQKAWQTVANNTSIFTANCLVSYLNSVQFPAPIPASYGSSSNN